MFRWFPLRSRVTLFRSKGPHATVPQVQQETNIDGACAPTHETADIRSRNDRSLRIAVLIQRAKDLQARYEQLREVNDLNEIIVLDREILSLCPPGRPGRSMPLSNLAADLTFRYKELGRIDDLKEAVVLGREVISHRPPGHPDRAVALTKLAHRLSCLYDQPGGINDLNEAILLNREAFSLCPPSHPVHSVSLNNLAICLSSRYERLGGMDDLNEALVLGRKVLSLCPPGHSDRSTSLNNLANHLSSRYEQLGRVDDLNEAIVFDQEALSLCPPGDPGRSGPLNNLANHLFSRYKRLGGIDDLNTALVLGQEVRLLHPPGHPGRPKALSNLANYLSSRYQRFGGIGDLNEALVLGQEALSLSSHGHPDHSTFLNNLAVDLSSRYEELGGIDDLSEAISLDREALSLFPSGNPHRWLSLNNLEKHLSFRFSRLGCIDDLNEALLLGREALSLCPPGHLARSGSLNYLAINLSSRYEQLGELDDLNEAIHFSRESLSLCPPTHLNRSGYLINLANFLSTRYERLRGIDDLDEAIDIGREALLLCTPGHLGRPSSLNNLSNRLSSRYEQLRRIDDLEEAISLSREALSLCSPGHLDRFAFLNGLASRLCSRYRDLRETDDLNEAIILGRDALSLCPSGHPDRSKSLSNLAVHLSSRYKQLWGIDDPDNIFFIQESFSLRLPGCLDYSEPLNNPSHDTSTLYDDLEEAIVLDREALLLHPPGHPRRSLSLKNLAYHLSCRYNHSKGIGDLDAAMEDKRELFGLYTELEHFSHAASAQDLSAAKAWVNRAEEFHHYTTLVAYETVLRLLVENMAALPPLPQHLTLLKSLSSSLAVDAFSACLRNQSPRKAVELLEQGRAVFWSQLTRLRSPLDDIITSGPEGKALANEFTRLTSLIRVTLHSSGPGQHDRVWSLNLELKKVVSKIRELPGFSRFLLPSLFSDLQRAARDGPVIIVNASKYGCDALVVFVDKDPIHVPLPVTIDDVWGLSSNLYTLRWLATRKKIDVTTGFKSFLRELWDRVVFHIVDVLQRTCPRQSRIWWCPTAEFSHLPLHAAMPYRKGQDSVSDLFISSYTTTLTALIHARRPDRESEEKRFIAIGQANAPGFTRLHSIHTELTNIKQHVKGVTTFTSIEGRDAHISGVTDKLSKNEWVHFACHGFSDQEWPFESAFALRDGMFSIQRIIQCKLENPEFAYLSACQTTVGDEENPDEMIHLASAMQFAGFRSVIGTMWSVADSPATRVASTFYKFMVDESGCLDYSCAAWALWKTLRTVDISMDQRILYIHLGA